MTHPILRVIPKDLINALERSDLPSSSDCVSYMDDLNNDPDVKIPLSGFWQSELGQLVDKAVKDMTDAEEITTESSLYYLNFLEGVNQTDDDSIECEEEDDYNDEVPEEDYDNFS